MRRKEERIVEDGVLDESLRSFSDVKWILVGDCFDLGQRGREDEVKGRTLDEILIHQDFMRTIRWLDMSISSRSFQIEYLSQFSIVE